MRYRTFGRLGWRVSDIGYGMWGMVAWTGADDEQSAASLERAVALGCNFFDTAWAYGKGRSEHLLGALVRENPDKRLYIATKVPPRNMEWPARPEAPAAEAYSRDHVLDYARRSLANLGVETIDLLQLHVWADAWTDDDGWKQAAEELKRDGVIRGLGISVNRFQPDTVLRALETGLVDSVQVVYNLLDQSPEDTLFPACQRLGVAVIARVPFDEGSLSGTLTAGTTWPRDDWRNTYFSPENLRATVERVDRLRADVPADMTLPELALRFILHHPAVSTTIPGMRKTAHVEANLAASDRPPLGPALLARLRQHRWNR